MSKDYYIGIDVGGTKVLTALADEKGLILKKAQEPTEADKGEEAIISNIKKSIDRVINNSPITKKEVKRIGIGSPGPLDLEKGLIIENSNLSWTNVPIVEILEASPDGLSEHELLQASTYNRSSHLENCLRVLGRLARSWEELAEQNVQPGGEQAASPSHTESSAPSSDSADPTGDRVPSLSISA